MFCKNIKHYETEIKKAFQDMFYHGKTVTSYITVFLGFFLNRKISFTFTCRDDALHFTVLTGERRLAFLCRKLVS